MALIQGYLSDDLCAPRLMVRCGYTLSSLLRPRHLSRAKRGNRNKREQAKKERGQGTAVSNGVFYRGWHTSSDKHGSTRDKIHDSMEHRHPAAALILPRFLVWWAKSAGGFSSPGGVTRPAHSKASTTAPNTWRTQQQLYVAVRCGRETQV